MKRQIFIHGQLHKQPELQSIIKKHGMGGLGLSVMIIEVLADRDYTSNEIHLIAKELEEDLEQVTKCFIKTKEISKKIKFILF